MDLNNKQTNIYVTYKKRIDEIWQDQVDAGAMFGRASLREVSESFKNLKEKIEIDSELSQNYKNELLEIIINKLSLAKEREEEILKAEQSYNTTKDEAAAKALSRFEKLPGSERQKYVHLQELLKYNGYHIFVNPDEYDNMFNGEKEYGQLKERLEKEYPVISKDIGKVLEETEKRLGQQK